MWSHPVSVFIIFLRKVLPWCLNSEQHSLLVGSMQSARPAATSSCQTIPPLCLQWILEESYLEGSLMSLKKTPNKQTYVVSAPGKILILLLNAEIGLICSHILHPASHSLLTTTHRSVPLFRRERMQCFAEGKGDLPCTAALKQGPFSLSTKSRFPWRSSESSTRRQPVPKSWHQELPTNTRCSESPACSASLRSRPWAGAFTSPATSVVGE